MRVTRLPNLSDLVGVQDDGKVSGLISLEALRAYYYDEDMGRLAIAADCATPYVAVRMGDTLAKALEQFAASHYPELPVVADGDPTQIQGLLSYDELLTAYSRDLLRRRLEAESAPGL
jgi:signal-transduction protein with cAMP-binding, CBS, and nucleotidyltransferase domain